MIVTCRNCQITNHNNSIIGTINWYHSLKHLLQPHYQFSYTYACRFTDIKSPSLVNNLVRLAENGFSLINSSQDFCTDSNSEIFGGNNALCRWQSHSGSSEITVIPYESDKIDRWICEQYRIEMLPLKPDHPILVPRGISPSWSRQGSIYLYSHDEASTTTSYRSLLDQYWRVRWFTTGFRLDLYTFPKPLRGCSHTRFFDA